MTKQLNILFSCNEQYAVPLTVSITSIFENNKDSKITVYVLYSTLLDNQKKNLNALAQQYNQNIILIEVESFFFKDSLELRWSKETYYRLLINELLPSDLERLLYLDCDIIINNDISELYNINLENNYIAALEIKDEDIPYLRKNINLSEQGSYFQAGVILFDMQKIKDILSYEKSIDILNTIGNKLLAVDQDVINVMFDGKIEPINSIFNNYNITNFNNSTLNRLFNYVNKADFGNTVIFHYATGKPWNNLYSGSCEKIWYKYLQISPYSELYKKKYNTLKYKLLRTSLFKTLFFEYIHITPIINNVSKYIFPSHIYDKLKKFYRKNIK